MELGAAGLTEQPFRSEGSPAVFVGYDGQEKAYRFLRQTSEHQSGLGLFQGPPLSGKTTIIRDFAEKYRDKGAVAIVDGARLKTAELLEAVLREFGYDYQFDSVNEMLAMLRVFILQRTGTGHPPVLVIENTHEMRPETMQVLCGLAEVRVREHYALRLILVSDRPIEYIVRADAMTCITKRLTGSFHLESLTMDETADYLYEKLRHGGCLDPMSVFPDEVCDELYHASGGWPGVLDRLAREAIENAEICPINAGHIDHPVVKNATYFQKSYDDGNVQQSNVEVLPVIWLTHNGKAVRKIKFEGTRLLVGRSEHNDICIDSRFVSRHHALLVRHDKSTLLMDLNSANGTYVNSRRVSNQVLSHDDVITLGDHGLKFISPNVTHRLPIDRISLNETVVMNTLEDMRRAVARESSENLPTGS